MCIRDSYYDQAKTIKDKVHLAPTITKVNLFNPVYVNLTSPSNWEYDWDNATANLNLQVSVETYISQARYVSVKVIGVCPNSFLFSSNNYSVSFSHRNWF